MKLSLISCCLVFLLCFSNTATAAEEITPQYSILSNSFLEIKIVDEYLLGLSFHSLAVFAFDSSLELFYQVNQMLLTGTVRNTKLFESTLAVRLADNRLKFIDLSNLPEMAVLGEVRPDNNYSDYALVGNSLYLSHWFEGIGEYEITKFNALSHVKTDSSGVLMTQLKQYDGYLYALDMYNGVIRYDLNTDFGSKVNKLLVRQRPFAFSIVDSLILVSLNSQGLLIGRFENENGQVIDSISGMASPARVFETDNQLIFLSARNAAILSKEDYQMIAEFPIAFYHSSGDLLLINDREFLLLPKESGGVTRFSVDGEINTQELLERPGPVSTLIVNFNKIISGGSNNVLEWYEIGEAEIVNSGIISDRFPGFTDAVNYGSYLYALSSVRNVVEIFAREQDSYYLLDSFFVEAGSQTISLNSTEVSPELIVIISGNDFISRYELSVGGYALSSNWKFESPVSSFALMVNRLYVADRFGVLTVYDILNDNSLAECFKRQLYGTAWKVLSHRKIAMVFVRNTLTIYDGCNSPDSLIQLALPVLDATIFSDTLYTIGAKGMAVYDMTSGYPELVYSSSLRGSLISAFLGLIATTDGSALHIYKLSSDSSSVLIAQSEENKSARLLDNYPDPFNSSTVIQYELTKESIVRLTVYNLLGQQVATLVSALKPAGKHTVIWNGRDLNGNAIASGVYFYRLKTAETVLSKKMLLLK
ncbi:MAG: T9SS type A sorting domain-containing protein [candidate division Zixibacteria bacterium]|nr:T9SS type A sorting domain-containing protein [candidate division Zixibacteria bacterium]